MANANRLKAGSSHTVAKTQSSLIKGRQISNKIRLILDLLDYVDYVHSKACILCFRFLQSLQHQKFPVEYLKLFGFGKTFRDTIDMFYKGINMSVVSTLPIDLI